MSQNVFQKLGRYVLVREIAKGGMAVIYQGRLIGEAGFSKDFAIKKILPHWAENEEFVEMLINEAKTLVELQHPNIVQIVELAKANKTYFIVMEFVNGFDLRKIILKAKSQKTTIPPEIIYFIINESCKALEFAHHKNKTIHRDISPQNILVSLDGHVKVTDFGIAKVLGKTQQTATGVLKGKFSYMSPEQASGKNIDLQTDIFALGSVLYELLFLKKTFDGNNDLSIIEKVKTVQYEIPESGTDSPFLPVIQKCLKRSKEERYQTINELKKDLDQIYRQYNYSCDHSDISNFLDQIFENELKQAKEIQINVDQQTKIFMTEQRTQIRTPQQKTMILDQTIIDSKEENLPKTIIEDPTVLEDPTLLEQRTIVESKTQIHNNAKLKNKVSKNNTPSISNEKISKKTTALIFSILVLLSLYVFLKPNSKQKTNVQEKVSTQVEKGSNNLQQTVLNQNLKKVKTQIQPAISKKHTVSKPKVVPPLKAHIKLVASPKQAKVKIKTPNETFSKVGFFEKDFTIKENDSLNFFVTVELKEYHQETFEITLDKKHQNVEKNIQLKPILYGKLTLRAVPWGYASVDKEKSKSTPASFKLPVGKHKINMYFPPMKKSVSKEIEIFQDKTLTCKASFGKVSRLNCW